MAREIDLNLGSFARKFAARAPLCWIWNQLFHDRVRVKVIEDDVVNLEYATPNEAKRKVKFVDLRSLATYKMALILVYTTCG